MPIITHGWLIVTVGTDKADATRKVSRHIPSQSMTDTQCQLSRQYSDVMDKLLQAFSDIARYLPRLDRLKATFGDIGDFEQALGLIYSDIAEFYRRAYKFFRRKAWHVWFAFDWGLFERRFKSIIEKLRSHCDLLDREAAATHFSEMKIMRDKRELEEEHFERHRKSQSTQEVFTWLSAEEDGQEDYLHRISDNRQPGTCNWILEDQQICSWIEDTNGGPVCWMTGIPGAGKSFLCSLIIQNLETHQDLSSIYYFCGHQQNDKDIHATILRTLTIQLLRSHLDMAELVYQVYLQKGSSRSFPAMKRILKEILFTIPNTRIVLDGIDEYNHQTQREVLGSLLELQKHAGDTCKLLISSREEPTIRNAMSNKTHIKLDGRTTDGLTIFIQNKVKELKKHCPEKEPALMDRVEQRLQSNAKGMFLWVRLVCTMLQEQMSDLDFERAIEQLPDGLDEAYGLIMSRFRSLDSRLKERVFKILFWVSAAYRPISIHEVADGIALYPGQLILNKKTRSKNPQRDIVEICAPLLENSSNGILKLVHFSAKEYLLDEQSGPFIEIAKAHFNIAFSCIVNLTTALVIVPRHSDGATAADLENYAVQGRYGLQPYGHHFWAEHVLAYLENTRELDHALIEVLEAFSNVCRTHPLSWFEPDTGSASKPPSRGLSKLQKHPSLSNFISGWLRFKSKTKSTEVPAGDLRAQEEWQLQVDETYLSLIDCRFRDIVERLLLKKDSRLPPHLDQTDFQAFLERFSFVCRFLNCTHCFDTTGDRDAHEQSHLTTFPCLQCDFSKRGFSSRKDLERHTQSYHMSAEDFKIPTSLFEASTESRNGLDPDCGSYPGSARRSTCWNRRGRKVLQKGFRQVLAKVESESLLKNSSTIVLNLIRAKVEEEQYETLTDFRDDIRELSGGSSSMVDSEKGEEIKEICDQEIEKAITDFPAFANFGNSRLGSSTANSQSDIVSQQNFPKPFDNAENDLNISSNSSLGKRRPYWSVTEEQEFPELLEQCGRDFIKIADRLKTKTINDIDEYFIHLVSLGRTELLKVADAADAKLQWDLEATLPIFDNGGLEPAKLLSDTSSLDVRPGGLAYTAQTMEAMNPYHLHQQDLSGKRDTRFENSSNTTSPRAKTEHVQVLEKPKRSVRSRRARVLCDYCNRSMDGFHDEYALKKHVRRFHQATRQVWICDDISIDKRFLAKCKPCAASKRYSSEHYTSTHLRGHHFDATATAEKLSRWMRRMEEPNPNFDKNGPESASVDKICSPINWHGNKRQKINGTAALHIKPGISNNSDLLPSMLRTPKDSSMSSRATSHPVTPNLPQDSDGEGSAGSSSGDESSSFQQTLLLPDFSFENFLPASATTDQPIDDAGPPHHKDLTLIRPNLVRRLPHLDPFRKLACHDQVEELYRKLENELVGSERYTEALDSLTSLSRTLLRNLLDWRRRSTFEPSIPFSI